MLPALAHFKVIILITFQDLELNSTEATEWSARSGTRSSRQSVVIAIARTYRDLGPIVCDDDLRLQCGSVDWEGEECIATARQLCVFPREHDSQREPVIQPYWLCRTLRSARLSFGIMYLMSMLGLQGLIVCPTNVSNLDVACGYSDYLPIALDAGMSVFLANRLKA